MVRARPCTNCTNISRLSRGVPLNHVSYRIRLVPRYKEYGLIPVPILNILNIVG